LLLKKFKKKHEDSSLSYSDKEKKERYVEELQSVLGIRIRNRIRMFLDLPDQDPLVRGTDPDPNPSLFSRRGAD
jgi:hypothetical protein